jgi:ribosome-associated heat shock protein Hsp15
MDKWVWHARVVRTRSDAADLIASGRIRLNGVREIDPAHSLKPGDVLTIALSNSVRVLKVQAFAMRRGGAKDAQRLYIEP